MQTLAVITNSLALLDIKNATIFTIVKNILLKDFLEDNMDELVRKLQPIDCAQFMTAYCRVGIFDLELFEVLEMAFIKRIDEASGESCVTMFTSHANWCVDMVEQCLVQKSQPRKVYNHFKQYNEEFYEHLTVNLIRNLSDINLKGIFLVLSHGSLSHLKKRSNMRLMR